jgi:hypothetical protein
VLDLGAMQLKPFVELHVPPTGLFVDPLYMVYGPVPPDQLIVIVGPTAFAPVIAGAVVVAPAVKFDDVLSVALYKTLSVTVAVTVYDPLWGTS